MRAIHSTCLLALLLPVAAACGDDAAPGTGGGGGGDPSTAATTTSSATVTASSSASTTAASTAGGGGDGGGGGAGGSGAGGSAIDPRFQALADAVERDLDELGASGAAIALIEDGEITFAHGFGRKNDDEPVDAETLFRIGSVNKMLTATALLGEVERGNVALDDAITDVVPDLELFDPAWAPTIELGHMLSHTGGLSDFVDVVVPGAQQEDAALHDFLVGNGFRQSCYLMAPSGAFWNYSNPNYYLAGLAAEASSGTPYRALMAERVFEPLGMDRTFFLAEDVLADGNYAVGASTFPGLPAAIQPDTYDNAWGRPAGFATSSVADLARFVQFLLDGDDDVLGDELRAEMQSPIVSTREYGDVQSYGYGLGVLSGYFVGSGFYDQKMVAHGGDIPGFAADVYFLPEERFGFIALANADGAHLAHALDEVLDTFAPKPAPSDEPDVSVTDEDLATFAGSYDDPFNVGAMEITVVDGDLQIEMPDLDEAGIPYDRDLRHLAEETFILEVQGLRVPISFVVDATYARTRFFVATRVDTEVARPARTAAPSLSVTERRARVASVIAAASRERRNLLLPHRSR
jgi:CubicO group peptidase (beta-lactamase class C family)